jgi:hypothetical protein
LKVLGGVGTFFQEGSDKKKKYYTILKGNKNHGNF